MAQLNKTCMACKTKYSYCPNCSRADALKPTWYSEFCSETCKELWLTLTRYNMNRITKSEAKSVISELDIKPIDNYVDCVKRDYNKVMAEDKKPKRNKRIEIKPVDEAMDIESEPIVVELEAKIKEIFEDKAVIETCLKGSKNKQIHEVVIEKENE